MPACKIVHVRPGKRRKLRSNVTHSQPHSIASAANQASVTARPRVFVSAQSFYVNSPMSCGRGERPRGFPFGGLSGNQPLTTMGAC
jgi:hypothetical protein